MYYFKTSNFNLLLNFCRHYIDNSSYPIVLALTIRNLSNIWERCSLIAPRTAPTYTEGTHQLLHFVDTSSTSSYTRTVDDCTEPLGRLAFIQPHPRSRIPFTIILPGRQRTSQAFELLERRRRKRVKFSWVPRTSGRDARLCFCIVSFVEIVFYYLLQRWKIINILENLKVKQALLHIMYD